MSTAAGVGTSHQKALDAAGISGPDFVFVFASVGDEPRASTGGAPIPDDRRLGVPRPSTVIAEAAHARPGDEGRQN